MGSLSSILSYAQRIALGTQGQTVQYPAASNAWATPVSASTSHTSYGSYVTIVSSGNLTAHCLVGCLIVPSNTSLYGKLQVAYASSVGNEVVVYESEWDIDGNAIGGALHLPTYFPRKRIPNNYAVYVRTLATVTGQGPGVFCFFDPV